MIEEGDEECSRVLQLPRRCSPHDETTTGLIILRIVVQNLGRWTAFVGERMLEVKATDDSDL